MTEAEKRKHRCCFTGHRPEKLHCSEEVYRAELMREIRRAIDDGLHTFISGVAWGVDIVAAEVVLQHKASDPTIHLICAVPHPSFEKRMSEAWQQRYKAVLENADMRKSRRCVPGTSELKRKWTWTLRLPSCGC